MVLLLTDGESIDENTSKHKIDAFSSFNIIGIGTETGGKIPYQKTYKKDSNGDYALSLLQRESLKSLSTITEANYYEVSDQQNNEPVLYSNIRNYKGESSGITKIDVTGNKFYYFLYIALGLLILDVLITVKTIEI